jgi:methionyl-tRNA formyltransferase
MGLRFIFIGNRKFVLESLISAGLNLTRAFVVAGTHLERDIQRGEVKGVYDYVLISSKEELVSNLRQESFDIAVTNGCPYILPLASLPEAQYVNVHPSYLPDLRGVDPVIGAILRKRDSGATCHVIDSGVDTGPIISRVRIPFSEDLDVATLYQLSFAAEQQAFMQALARGFQPQQEQETKLDVIEYRRDNLDRLITFYEENDYLLQKIKAFNNLSAGCFFSVEGVTYRVFSAERLTNPYVVELLSGLKDCVVGMSYENSIVFRKDGEILRLTQVLCENQKTILIGANLLKP